MPPRRTPLGVRELKLYQAKTEYSSYRRTPLGVRELKSIVKIVHLKILIRRTPLGVRELK